MANFKNIDNFESWLTDNMKFGVIDLNAALEDVLKQYAETGSNNYELASFETQSGNPECYNYDVEESYNEEDDSYEYTFVF